MHTLGRHILVEFFGCDVDIMNDVSYIENSMITAAEDSGATIINSSFHHFSPFGVSGVVVIQESHLAIHTWPEFRYAAVDLFTCGGDVNPWIAFDTLKRLFKAENGSAMELLRGQIDLLKRVDVNLGELREDFETEIKQKNARNVWFTDRDENQALSLRHTGNILFRERSDFQLVEVFETYGFGKMLSIDKMVMVTEKDEFIYHEMIVHPAMTLMPDIKKVLVIGGGDGGTVRELLRHPQIDYIKMVEIDEVVVNASKEHFPNVSAQLTNEKLELVIGDGIEYVANCPESSYDLVIVDGSDPKGPAEGLFSEEFYKNIYKSLTPNGCLVAQSESPFFNQSTFQEIFECHKSIFGKDNVACYLAHIPTYPMGTWSFSICGKSALDPVGINESVMALLEKEDLQYYNKGIHYGAFALPNFVKKMV